jgi:hypothetical protein
LGRSSVPDGSDWIEYMLNIPTTAEHKELGAQNQFSPGVPSSKAAIDLIHARGLDLLREHFARKPSWLRLN